MTPNPPIKLIVFDMAGTTVNEDNVVYKTVLAAINAQGYAFTLDQVLETGAGKEKSQAIRDVLALDGSPHDEKEVQEIFSDFKSRLIEAYEQLNVKEQPGATETFDTLRQKGIQIVLNTGYSRPVAESLVAKIGWKVGEHIDGLVTASDVTVGRPGPEMIERAMSITGIENSATVVKVGDSKIDIEEGKNAKCGMTYGITTGAQTASQLMESNPDGILNGLSELVQIVAIEA